MACGTRAAAIAAQNVFYYLTYEGAVDVEARGVAGTRVCVALTLCRSGALTLPVLVRDRPLQAITDPLLLKATQDQIAYFGARTRVRSPAPCAVAAR